MIEIESFVKDGPGRWPWREKDGSCNAGVRLNAGLFLYGSLI